MVLLGHLPPSGSVCLSLCLTTAAVMDWCNRKVVQPIKEVVSGGITPWELGVSVGLGTLCGECGWLLRLRRSLLLHTQLTGTTCRARACRSLRL